MIRDFLSGAFWGTAVAALGMVAVSQLTPLPVERISAEASAVPRADVPQVEPVVVPAAEPAPLVEAAPVVQAAPVVEAAPVVQAAPLVEAAPVVQAAPVIEPAAKTPLESAADVAPPVVDEATLKPAADPAAEGKPGAATAAVDLAEPKPAEVPAKPVVAGAQTLDPPAGSEFTKPLPDETPVLPAAEAAPVQNEAAAPLVVTAADGASKAGETSVAPSTGLQVPKPLEAPETTEVAQAPVVADETQIAQLQPEQPAMPAADVAPSPAVAAPAAAAKPEAEPQVEPIVVPEQKPDPSPEPLPQVLPVPATPAEPAPVPAGEADPQLQPSATLQPTPALKGAVDGVRIGRLPRIGDAPAAAEGDPAPAASAVNPDGTPGLVLEDNADLPPLQKYARVFDNPDNKPVFSIILIDTGGADLDRASLAALPFAVTFALDPLAPNVAQASKIYRDAGQEVIMVATGIPAGATASDLEVTFQAHATALPEAVAVIDTEFGAFQSDRPLATQVVPILKAQGRGLISWDRGLNAADQVARRDGLAAGMVFRKLDGKGENKSAVRRALDRAAFKAAQDGRVLVIGQTLPETVAAITEWAGQSKAKAVALAPVSAALTSK